MREISREREKERLRETLACEKGLWWWEVACLAGKNGGQGSLRKGERRGNYVILEKSGNFIHAYHVFFFLTTEDKISLLPFI